MKRHLIIDGTAVYEIDEDCMLKKRVDKNAEREEPKRSEKRESPGNAKRRIPGL